MRECLVRSKKPIKHPGLEFRMGHEHERWYMLKAKMLEEVGEFFFAVDYEGTTDQELEELADVVQVGMDITGCTLEELIKAVQSKAESDGTFDGTIYTDYHRGTRE